MEAQGVMARSVRLPVIHLAPHQFEAASCDAIRSTVVRANSTFGFELFEQPQCTAAQQVAVAIKKFETVRFAVVISEQRDTATLREGMQHPLFVSGNIHWE